MNKKNAEKINIKIENFGPVKKADFDLKPLTIFTGPNNSGKSYSAILIHALTHYLSGTQYDVPLQVFWSNLTVSMLQKGIKNNPNNFADFYTDLSEFLKTKPTMNETFEYKKRDLETLIYEGLGEFYSEVLQQKMESLFASDLSKLILTGETSLYFSKNDFKFLFDKDDIKVVNFPKINFKLLEKDYHPHIKIKEKKDIIKFNINYEVLKKEDYSTTTMVSMVLFQIYNSLGTPILKQLLTKYSFYLPAARSGIMQSFKSFMSATVMLSSAGGSSISGVITGFAASIGDLNVKNKTDFYDVTTNFEEKLIGGKIIFVDPSAKYGLPDIFYEKGDIKIPFNLVSSSIAELSPLFLFLKHLVKKGDTLIIEEPEAHLHPGNQILLVEFLVKLINMGLNLIITTHSDFIIEKINNFVLLERNITNIKDYGYDSGDYLKREQVGLYLFKQDKETQTYSTENVEISEMGISENNFGPVIDALYNESHNIKQDIFNRENPNGN